MRTFRKERFDAPTGFFHCEAAGLQWLGSAGGAPCVEVLDAGENHLLLDRLTETAPSRESALEFGAGLARTHDAGAPAFGSPPEGWTGPGYFGPTGDPLPMAYAEEPAWGAFYAEARLQPLLELPRAAHAFSEQTRRLIEAVNNRLLNGDFDDGDSPARIHGDLWNGNLMWTSGGATLIDSAAHGGHRETDLAFLALFGCPFLDRIVEGYEQVHGLQAGWRDRIPLHQLYPLMVHAILFGGRYAASTGAAARALLKL
ncbi:fructosamine kinase family protein [Arthrobacter roseus]|uniref:fructosamine kinase family protein n=1 Tax=Arthrobacter roseus TaxID=136274 RepID=UPI001964F9B0|nr:fructosamine kinase family protein [Arthrobacter roseus]MBM7849286.1 fructosamine-3-kinase [Arthrobacter roseus]